MNVRSQISMVFHLDKCIGCHTCSIACKNIWTDRKGAEYMWWNNVETKPGTGYPTAWEDQEKYKGGWEKNWDKLEVRAVGKEREEMKRMADIFRGRIIDVTDKSYTVELTGDQSKNDAFLQAIDRTAILETVRTGASGIGRGERILRV